MVISNVLSFTVHNKYNPTTLYTAVTNPFHGFMSSIATSVLFQRVTFSSLAILQFGNIFAYCYQEE